MAGYLIDFPRTINSLVGHSDSSYQVQMFQNTLGKEPYFANAFGTSLAILCSWKDFLDWLNEADPGRPPGVAQGLGSKRSGSEVLEGDIAQGKSNPSFFQFLWKQFWPPGYQQLR
jgi:hypothetical protein